MALDQDIKEWLTRNMGNSVLFDEPMSRHTYIRVGGPADAYIRPKSLEEFKNLIKWIRQNKISYIVVGGGSNLVVKDNGIRGLVISLTRCLNDVFEVKEKSGVVKVTAMAGAKMQSLCSFAIEKGFKGMNFAIGIPGTVGGGIAMNAGTTAGSIQDVIESIKVLLPEHEIHTLSRDKLNFNYRELIWDNHISEDTKDRPIILEGCFRLLPFNKQTLKNEAKKMLENRMNQQPTNQPSAGCFFKNPSYGKSAGQLIDLAGLKNTKVGGAMVSSKHANFIVNTGHATTRDILELMKVVQDKVAERFNVNLKPEVKIIGT